MADAKPKPRDRTAAGSYVVGFYRGVIRHKGWPWYRCTHQHGDPREASSCAKDAKRAIDAQPEGAPLPAHWVVWQRGQD